MQIFVNMLLMSIWIKESKKEMIHLNKLNYKMIASSMFGSQLFNNGM